MKDLTCFEPKYRPLVGYLTGEESERIDGYQNVMLYILKDVSEKTHLAESEIIFHTRRREIVEARNMFCKLSRKQGIPFAEIGKFAGVHYTTAIYACRVVDEIPSLRKKYQELFES